MPLCISQEDLSVLIRRAGETCQVLEPEATRIVVLVLKKKGIELPNPPINQAITSEGYGTIPVGPPDIGQYRTAFTTRLAQKDQNWPLDGNPKDDAIRKGEGQYGTQPGFPQYKDDDDYSPAANKDRKPKNEIDIQGAAPGREDLLLKSKKDTQERTKEWSHGKQFDMDGDFDDVKPTNDTRESKMIKADLSDRILVKEFRKHLFAEVKRTIAKKVVSKRESSFDRFKALVVEHITRDMFSDPTTDSGISMQMSIEDTPKADVQKDNSHLNPWLLAWSVKGKKNEAPSLLEFKEACDEYMKEMGFEKCASKKDMDIWRNKKEKK